MSEAIKDVEVFLSRGMSLMIHGDIAREFHLKPKQILTDDLFQEILEEADFKRIQKLRKINHE